MKTLPVVIVMFVSLTVGLLAAPAPVFAQGVCEKSTFFGVPSWDNYLQKDSTRGCAIVNFNFPDDLWLVVLGVLDILFRLATYVAVGFIIWGSWKLITSTGNPEGVKAGRETILNAVIGLVLTIAASLIVRFVAGFF